MLRQVTYTPIISEKTADSMLHMGRADLTLRRAPHNRRQIKNIRSRTLSRPTPFDSAIFLQCDFYLRLSIQCSIIRCPSFDPCEHDLVFRTVHRKLRTAAVRSFIRRLTQQQALHRCIQIYPLNGLLISLRTAIIGPTTRTLTGIPNLVHLG